jgi:hypothetical protein
MNALYKDRWIECTADAVLIHGYYFPWGTKRVPYSSILEVRRVPIGTFQDKQHVSFGRTDPGYEPS